MDKFLSEMWCICTLGYTKRLLNYALGYEIKVKLIEGVKTGSNRCVMKIMKEEA